MTESDLHQELLDQLQRIMLEFGREFCFMSRQVRIASGDGHQCLDLLFTHRRLLCIVAIVLKLGEYLPEYAEQMHFCLNDLAQYMAHADQNPPVGILLCAAKDEEVVRFIMAGNDEPCVARYQLELPAASQLREWLHRGRAQIERVQALPESAR